MEFFGISGGECIIILIVCIIVLGPEAIIQGLRTLRSAINAAKGFSARVREETRSDLSATGLSDLTSSLDFSGLDPRQMIRNAVREEMDAWMKQAQSSPATPSQSPPATPPIPPTAAPTHPA
ncbi:translocase [Trueperella sp. LYQ143]|uniref:translocase n=1 Tax=unclassified Trueperella TaxID=2630174 RepID=UPI00398369EC